MDLTNRYVMMCQKATDIQKLWVPKPCDFMIDQADMEENFSFCSPAASIVQVVDSYIGAPDSEDYKNESEHLKKNSLWLPRQDQIQKLMEQFGISTERLIEVYAKEFTHLFGVFFGSSSSLQHQSHQTLGIQAPCDLVDDQSMMRSFLVLRPSFVTVLSSFSMKTSSPSLMMSKFL